MLLRVDMVDDKLENVVKVAFRGAAGVRPVGVQFLPRMALAIGFEGLFYVSYSLALCLWVEVESVLREHARDRDVPSRKEEPTNKRDAGAYRPKADDLRIAVFFLFFVQVAFFGTGK